MSGTFKMPFRQIRKIFGLTSKSDKFRQILENRFVFFLIFQIEFFFLMNSEI